MPIQINLIPPRVREVARRKEQVFYWVLSLVTMYLILASIIPVTAQKDEQVQARISQLKQVIARYDASLINDPQSRSDFEDEFEIVNSDIRELQGDVQVLDDMRQYRNFWLPYLQAINDARPISGIGISLIEAIVIGADSNTGPAAWRAQDGQAPAAAPAAPAEAAAPSPPPAARTGIGGFAQLAGQLGGVGGGGGGGGGGAGGQVRGFGGVNPHPLIEPNGLSIVGYASSIEVAREFETNLRNSGKFVDVWLDEQYFDFVPETDLASARTASPVSGRSRAPREPRGDRGGGLTGAGFESLVQSTPRTGTATTPGMDTGVELFVFHIDVQFVGQPNPRPPARVATTAGDRR